MVGLVELAMIFASAVLCSSRSKGSSSSNQVGRVTKCSIYESYLVRCARPRPKLHFRIHLILLQLLERVLHVVMGANDALC